MLPPPTLNPHKAPSEIELGINEPSDPNWPLSVKRVTMVNIDLVINTKTRFQTEVARAFKWLCTDEYYGQPYVNEARIPKAKLTGDQLQVTFDFEKVEPHKGPIRGVVNVFLVAQAAKRNWRMICEPGMNRTCETSMLPTLVYETRLGRRERARGKRFMGEFDFSSYFDAFEIPSHLRDFYVFMAQDTEENWGLYHLTRMPMGARYAPGVAQYTTWVILEKVSEECPSAVLDSMTDNVRICEEQQDSFVSAVKSFIKWTRTFNITLNRGDGPDLDLAGDEEWLQWGSQHRIFLGELYLVQEVFTHVCNTEKTVSKVKRAFAKMSERTLGYTKRNFSSFVSLVCFALHTIGLTPRDYRSLMKAHSAVCATVHKDEGWDEPIDFIHGSVMTEAKNVTDILVANVPRMIKVRIPPSYDNEVYETLGIVDSSGQGWATYANIGDKVFEVTEGWQVGDESFVDHSASSEPQGVLRALAWILPRTSPTGRVAIVTDHSAIVWAQNKWESDFGGVGRGLHLNSLYRFVGGRRVDFFFVPGNRNIVDGPSRRVSRYEKISWRVVSLQFPRLAEFFHPYLTKRAIPDYAK